MKKCFLIVAFLLLAVNLYAGSAYELKCSKCGDKTTLYYGRGELFEVIANGYCLYCKQYVRISYNQPDIPKEKRTDIVTPISYVYSPLFVNARRRALYPCRFCKKPFAEILYEDLKDSMNNRYCPKCSTNSVNVTPKTWD